MSSSKARLGILGSRSCTVGYHAIKSSVDIISDKIKTLESQFEIRLNAGTPFVVRLDGCSFRNYTSGMKRPFDPRLTLSMVRTMNELIDHTGALLGFTQSDEISLVYRADPILNNYPYNGRIGKIQSIYAGMASAKFNYCMQQFDWGDVPEKVRTRIFTSSAWFDARCFSVPDDVTAMEAVYWRHKYDCRRNAIHTIGLAHFDPKHLHGMSLQQVVEMLDDRDVKIFQDIPKIYLYGVFGKKLLVQVPYKNPITNESGTVARSRLQNRILNMSGSVEQRTDMVMSRHWEHHHQESVETLDATLPVQYLPPCQKPEIHGRKDVEGIES